MGTIQQNKKYILRRAPCRPFLFIADAYFFSVNGRRPEFTLLCQFSATEDLSFQITLAQKSEFKFLLKHFLLKIYTLLVYLKIHSLSMFTTQLMFYSRRIEIWDFQRLSFTGIRPLWRRSSAVDGKKYLSPTTQAGVVLEAIISNYNHADFQKGKRKLCKVS